MGMADGSMIEVADGHEARQHGGVGVWTGRSRSIDILKGVSIIGVVMIHSDMPLSEVFRFAVPVFIAIWAYFLETGLARRDSHERTRYLMGRLGRLAVVYAFWTAVYLLVFHIHEFRTISIGRGINAWLAGLGWPGQYFFVILFQLVFVMPVMRRCITQRRVWWIIICSGLFNVIAPYVIWGHCPYATSLGHRVFIYWLCYVAVGIGLARGYVQLRPVLLWPAMMLLIFTPLELHLAERWVPAISPYLPFTVTLGTILLLMAIGPSHRSDASAPMPLRLERCGALLAWIGRNSMVIFVCNPLMIFLVRWALSDWAGPGVFISMSAVVCAVSGAMLIGWMFRKIGLGFLVG